MNQLFEIGDLTIELIPKRVKHVHLAVHPPKGRITLVVPVGTRLEVAHAYAVSKLGWIRKHQARFLNQERESPRQYVSRESHYVWGRRHLLYIEHRDEKPSVSMNHRTITLTVRPRSSFEKRAQVMHEWHKSLLHQAVPKMIAKWEPALGVHVNEYFLQRMKTRWGSCNPRQRNIRFNTELVKKSQDLLEYVVVHEMLHLIEPTHSPRFVALMDRYYPAWQWARVELNELPLGT